MPLQCNASLRVRAFLDDAGAMRKARVLGVTFRLPIKKPAGVRRPDRLGYGCSGLLLGAAQARCYFPFELTMPSDTLFGVSE